MEINYSPTFKQDLLFEYCEDDTTTDILYGGGAGSAKSYGLCSYIIMTALKYPGVRLALGRSQLKNLKRTTLVTLFEVFNDWGLSQNIHWVYNEMKAEIRFTNGSVLLLLDLFLYPSDSEFTSLGGLLLTQGFIDEAGEITRKAKQILQSRCGRWKNDKYKLKPLLVSTCNPAKNYLYTDYYLPFKNNELPEHVKFINATIKDNPYLSDSYKNNLERTLGFQDKQRLLYGNWDYADDDNTLIPYQNVLNMFSDVDVKDDDEYYISADIAFTSDRCVIILWRGLTILNIDILPKSSKPEDTIKDLINEYGINPRNVVYDSDGVGQYLKTYLNSSVAFVNNSTPLNRENYQNLKSQVYFKMAELINNGEVKIKDKTYYDDIILEFQYIKSKPLDVLDGKLSLISKKDIKKQLGRSPDIVDAIAYRMYFQLKKKVGRTFSF